MVDQGLIDKCDYNNDYVSKLLEVNEYLTSPAFINIDNKKYLIDYQDSDGYNTYAIVNDDKVYGLAYKEDNEEEVSFYKNNETYVYNQEKIFQKINKDDYIEDELSMTYKGDNNYLTYIKVSPSGYTCSLAYLANQKDNKILLNHLLAYKKRPLIIVIAKAYFRIGIINAYKSKTLQQYKDGYITTGIKNIYYTYNQVDKLLSDLNLPGFIPDDVIKTYLDKDEEIKTLKKVVKTYKNNYIK